MIEKTTPPQPLQNNQQNLKVDLIEYLTARISHDLSNPMMIFNNVLEIIKAKNYQCTNRELREYVDMLTTSSLRLNMHVKTLAYFNSQRLHVKRESLLQIIKNVISGLCIPPSIRISLPKKDTRIEMDVEQMETLLFILVSNALQVLNNKGVIMIRLKEFDDDVVLEVEDVGDGITMELLPKLFDPTFINRKVGSCLGLPTCKRIIENHGGAISVDSNPFGTTFSLKLLKKIDVHSNLISFLSRM